MLPLVQSPQVAALSTAFMSMMIVSGTPPMLAGLTMAFHTNLFGAITHYASGQGPGCYCSECPFKTLVNSRFLI